MAKSGTLKTNTITEYGVSIYGQLDWTSTQNIDANKDIVTWTLKTKNNPTGYYRSVTNAKVTINGSVVGSRTASISAYNDTTILNGTTDVPHNNDGTKTFAIAIQMAIGQTTVNATGSGNFTLDTIPRGNTYSIDKTMLSKDESATITINKAISTNKSTINWSRGTTSGTLATKTSATSVSVSYDTIKSGMQSGTNAIVTFECVSYNSSGTEVGNRTTLQIAVSTGKIPMSLYDDGNGDVGATFGGRATQGGVNILTDVRFGDDANQISLDCINCFADNYEVLWSGTATSMAQETLITKRLDSYNALVIVTETEGALRYDLLVKPKSEKNWFNKKIRVNSSFAGRLAFRNFICYYTGITASNGYYYKTYGSSTQTLDNTCIVPRFIIGVHI